MAECEHRRHDMYIVYTYERVVPVAHFLIRFADRVENWKRSEEYNNIITSHHDADDADDADDDDDDHMELCTRLSIVAYGAQTHSLIYYSSIHLRHIMIIIYV